MTLLNEAGSIRLGNQVVDAVYAGSVKVWPTISSGYASAVQADSPVAWWRMTDLTDATGGGRTLTAPVGGVITDVANLVDGGVPVNGAKFLNGYQTTGFLRADDAALSPLTAMSWECVITPHVSGIGQSAMNLLKKGLHVLGTRATGRIYWQVQTPDGATWLDGTTVLTAGETYHLVGTASNGTYRLYINGVEEPGSFSYSNSISDNSDPFVIGGTSSDATYVGAIDEIAVYNTALSSARVLAHFKAGISPVRNFNGTTDVIRTIAPPWFGATPVTFVATLKRDTPGVDWEAIFSIGGSTGNPWLVWEFGSNNGTYGMEYVIPGAMHYWQQHPTLWNKSGWQMVAVTVYPGNNTAPRFHQFDGETFTHVSATAGTTGITPADWTGLNGLQMRIGQWDASYNYIDGSLASLAWFVGVAKDDAAIEALAPGDRASWIAKGATNLWEFNQSLVTDQVVDLVGSAHQMSLSGTAVVTSNPPPIGIYKF